MNTWWRSLKSLRDGEQIGRSIPSESKLLHTTARSWWRCSSLLPSINWSKRASIVESFNPASFLPVFLSLLICSTVGHNAQQLYFSLHATYGLEPVPLRVETCWLKRCWLASSPVLQRSDEISLNLRKAGGISFHILLSPYDAYDVFKLKAALRSPNQCTSFCPHAVKMMLLKISLSLLSLRLCSAIASPRQDIPTTIIEAIESATTCAACDVYYYSS